MPCTCDICIIDRALNTKDPFICPACTIAAMILTCPEHDIRIKLFRHYFAIEKGDDPYEAIRNIGTYLKKLSKKHPYKKRLMDLYCMKTDLNDCLNDQKFGKLYISYFIKSENLKN